MTRKALIRTVLNVTLFALVLLGLYVVFRRIGFRRILRAASGADLGTIGNAALLFIASFALWCIRWTRVMRREYYRSVPAVFPAYMAGLFVNLITPGARVGGEPVRAYYMHKAFGRPKTVYLGTILADKVGYASVFFGFLVVSVVFVVAFVRVPLAYKLLLGGAVLGVLTVVISGFLLREQIGMRSRLFTAILRNVYDVRPVRFLRVRFPTYQHFEAYILDKMDNLFRPFARVTGSPWVAVQVVALSAISWLLVVQAHDTLFTALGADIGFAKVLVIVTISTFLGDISVSPGGLGFMEAAIMALCAAFGVRGETAAAVTLVSRGVFYACGLSLGGACLLGLSLHYGLVSDASTPAEGSNSHGEVR